MLRYRPLISLMPKNWLGHSLDQTPDLNAVLKESFGHESFQPGQLEIIEAIMQGRDALAVMPTGSGKSLCYQLPALLREKGEPTLVVSPLIALMRDQVTALRAKGIPAAAVYSGQAAPFQEAVARRTVEGNIAVLYVSPERLRARRFKEYVANVPFRVITDEAHCVCSWGHSFRPDYLAIGKFAKGADKQRQIAGFTATANGLMRKEIKKWLKLQDPFEYKGDLYRPNLNYRVIDLSRESNAHQLKREHLRELIDDCPEGSIVVYCHTVNHTIDLFDWAKRQHDICDEDEVAYYNGQMDPKTRKEVEEQFMSGEKRILFATNAFGMGVDKSDIRLIVHHGLPESIVDYLQETGRAGRDGEEAECVILYNQADARFRKQLIADAPDGEYVGKVKAWLTGLHNGGAKNVGKPFAIGWDRLVQQVSGRKPNRSSRPKVFTAVNLLVQYGFLRRLDNGKFIITKQNWGGSTGKLLRRTLAKEKNIRLESLDELVAYLEAENPTQEMLVRAL